MQWQAVLLPYLLGLLTAFNAGRCGVLPITPPRDAADSVDGAAYPSADADNRPLLTPGPIVVYVSGVVVTPGTFVLAPGARIADAIMCAGGLRADVDGALVNQAEHLFDGAQVHVPGRE